MFRRRSLLAACLTLPLSLMAGCALTPGQTAPATRTIVVFFTADSASLDPAAQDAIKQAASTANERPNATVHVRGFTAPDAGSAAFNQSLSRTRAVGVVDALVNAGVPRARISTESRGAVGYDLMPVESRRVEILVGP